MNKSIYLFVALIFSGICFSQISVSSWTNSYLQINSYNENINPDAYTVTFTGNGNINAPNWKLSARLKQSITANSGNYIFPANKISFQPVSSVGLAYPNPVPSLAEIGIPLNTIMQEGAEFFLIPNSNAALYNQPSQPNGYYNLQLKFSLKVAGGAYLGNYPSWITFTAPVEFTAYDQNNNIIGKMDHQFRFHIGKLSGAPANVPELSLKVNGNAVNGILEFKSIQDYRDGASVTYSKAISVKSNTNYQITVRAVQGNFTSQQGNSIPVNTVQLVLLPLLQNHSLVYPVSLTMSPQLIAKGSSSQGSYYDYDMKYFTKPNDKYFINAKPEEYSAILQYEITPQ